jgi:hypothetical protein
LDGKINLEVLDMNGVLNLVFIFLIGSSVYGGMPLMEMMVNIMK